MKIKIVQSNSLAALVSLCLLASQPIASAATTLYPSNNGFEKDNAHEYGFFKGSWYAWYPDLNGYGWTYSGDTGIAAAGGAYNPQNVVNGNNNAEGIVDTTSVDGQCAYIQSLNGEISSIKQTFTLAATGLTTVNFSIESRDLSQNLPIQVLVNNGSETFDLGTYAPTSSSSFTIITSSGFAGVSGSSYTLEFVSVAGAGTTDRTTFVDSISIATVPEPSVIAFSALGLGLALFMARRQRAGFKIA